MVTVDPTPPENDDAQKNGLKNMVHTRTTFLIDKQKRRNTMLQYRPTSYLL